MAMRIKIQETGEVMGLSIIDTDNGVDWILDLIGNSGDDYEYDQDVEATIMTQEAYDFWVEYIKHFGADKEEIEALEAAIHAKYHADDEGNSQAQEIINELYAEMEPNDMTDEHMRKQAGMKLIRERYEIG